MSVLMTTFLIMQAIFVGFMGYKIMILEESITILKKSVKEPSVVFKPLNENIKALVPIIQSNLERIIELEYKAGIKPR